MLVINKDRQATSENMLFRFCRGLKVNQSTVIQLAIHLLWAFSIESDSNIQLCQALPTKATDCVSDRKSNQLHFTTRISGIT